MRKAGVTKLPIESHILQAFVTEPLKPLIHCVVTFGAGHMYVSQSDKGGLVYGGNLDYYNSYAQRGNLPIVHEVASELLAVFPNVGKVRLLRSWGGIMDMSMDGSPIITTGPLPGHVSELPAGTTAASRRRPARAGASPTRSPTTSRTRSTPPSRSSASTRAGPSTRGAPARRRGSIRFTQMLIPCPVCGLRDHGEFTYGGDATIVRPAIADADPARWAAYVYDRENPRGHAHGILAPRPRLPAVDGRSSATRRRTT